MKKLLSILILCLGCFGFLEAQDNIWKPINGTGILGAGSDGSIFAYGEYGALSRSQDEGETWQIVLGQETGFTGFIHSSCFAVSNEGRICVFNDNQQAVVYSDDAGDTWQQTTALSLCGLPTKAGICAPTNDVFVVWAENGEISYTLDGGETWDGWILDFLENAEAVSDLLVNETGDVYVSVAYYIMNIVGIYHSTLSDIQNWELVAFEGISIKDMAFDPEGNVVACGYNADGSSAGFQHIPGFYLFDGTTLAISDGGIVYRPHFVGNQAVLSYSIDHGEHFTDIGEHVPLVDIAPGGDAFFLIKGYDNHLYFDGGGNYWKSVRNANQITSVGDEELLAYCEPPEYFYGWPSIDQGTCRTQILWHHPLGSKWLHYDEQPYAGSVFCDFWGIRIPAEEIQSGDVLTHVAFYKAGCQNQTAHYVFAFCIGDEIGASNLQFLPGNSVQIEPGPDEWVMVKLRNPINCEEGKSLWIVLTAPNVEGNNAPYCQTSGNQDGRWASLGGGTWYDYSSVQGGGGDWLVRGYLNHHYDYGYNEDFDHYNLYRGRSLEELEKIAELDRDEVEYNDTLQNPFGDYYYSLTASYTDGRESDPEEAYGYFHVGNMSSLGSEWYYEIQNEDGSITYQHLEYASDTTVNDKEVKIIIRTNTLYDKGRSEEKTREYIYEDFGKVYWWNETRQDFTLLYDLGAQIGDEWTIWVGTESITMHVDTVEQYEYEGTTYRMLRVSDANGLFSGEILSGIGHLTSFFPERLMTRGEKYRVEGIRCYWREGDLVFKYGDRDCDEVYEQYHFGIEEDGPSTGSGTLTVYPNPTDGVLFVETHGRASLSNQTYRITNLMGQTLMSGQITAETQQIDVSNLPEGMYFISVGDMTRKFVVR